MLRIIREEEPSRPSIKLDTSESLPSIAANRHVDPKRLSLLVRGELDWIVMKALEKDRTRRYDTANAFADDIANYLSDAPVAACPPNTAYQIRKFLRRNKEVAITCGLIAATLMIGVVATSWQAWRASNQRDRAVTAEHLAAQRLTSETAARIEAESARKAESVARAQEQRAADERRQALVRQYVRRGTEYVDEGDHTTALPWFLKALEMDGDDPDRQYIHRLRIATTMSRCAKLTSWLRPTHRVDDIQFFADGSRVLLRAYIYSRAVSVWRLNGEEERFPIDLGEFATLSPDGRRIAVLREEAVLIADSDDGSILQTLDSAKGRPVRAGFGSDGRLLFVIDDSPAIRVWDSTSGQPVTPRLDEGFASLLHAAFSADDRYLIASDQSGLLHQWELSDPLLRRRVTKLIRFNGFQWSYLAAGDTSVAVPEDVFVAVADLQTGKRAYPRLAHADGVNSVRLSPDGKHWLTCSNDHTARVWEVASGEPVTDWIRHNAKIQVAEFSPDGRLIATGSTDGEISIWDATTGKRAFSRLRHPDRIWSVRFTSDSRRLLTSSIDGGTRVWDLASALAAPSLVRNQEFWVPELGFTDSEESGLRLYAASQGRRVITYDLASHSNVAQRIPFDAHLNSARLHPDKESLITTSYDGSVSRSRLMDGGTIFRRADFRVAPEDAPHVNLRCGVSQPGRRNVR